MRSAATSPSTRSSTTSPPSRSSTTSAASRTCARGVDPLHRRSRRAVPGGSRCGCCAPSRSPRGSTSRSTRRSSTRFAAHAARDRAERAGAARSRSSTRFCASGAAERAFRELADTGCCEPMAPELARRSTGDALWESLAALDRYRQRFEATPDTLTNADPARHAARAARLHRATALRAERSDVRIAPARPTTTRAIAGGASATSGATRRPRWAPAGGAARHRAAAADPRPAAAAARHADAVPRAQARADAPRPFPRSAHLARDPRPRAGDRRALARVHRGHRLGRSRSSEQRPAPPRGAGDGAGAAAQADRRAVRGRACGPEFRVPRSRSGCRVPDCVPGSPLRLPGPA